MLSILVNTDVNSILNKGDIEDSNISGAVRVFRSAHSGAFVSPVAQYRNLILVLMMGGGCDGVCIVCYVVVYLYIDIQVVYTTASVK